MSDEPGWASPSGPGSAPAHTPWSAPTPWSPPASAPSAPPGWTPPPKPGLVPLRPMTLGTILGAMLRVMRRNPLPTLGLSLVLTFVASLLSAGFFALVFTPLGLGGSATDPAAITGAALLSVVGGLLAVLAQLLVASLLQGVVTLEVASGTLGERMRTIGHWRRIRPRLPRLLGWLALLILAAVIVIGLLILVIAGLAALGTAGIVPAVLVGVFGSLGLVVLFAWLGTKLLFVTPAIVLERRGVFSSIVRSWRLGRGWFWRTFGILALVIAIVTVASWVIVVPIQFVASILIATVGVGTTDPTAAVAPVIVAYAASLLVSVLIGAIGQVMVSATVALLYIDTRMRVEGLDLELSRAAEARAVGAPFDDPYAVT